MKALNAVGYGLLAAGIWWASLTWIPGFATLSQYPVLIILVVSITAYYSGRTDVRER